MNDQKKELLKLRMSIGFLGAILPIVLWLGNDRVLLNSISHYYYTSSAIFFIGIVFSLAIVLFSYHGHEKLKSEKLSDNFITSIAALFALIAVLVPTSSLDPGAVLHFEEHPYLFGHKANKLLSVVHTVSAGIFIALLGYMPYFKFVLSENNSAKLNKFYKACGIIIWTSIVLMIVLMGVEKYVYKELEEVFKYVWWFECLAVETFALAWIRKARVLKFL